MRKNQINLVYSGFFIGLFTVLPCFFTPTCRGRFELKLPQNFWGTGRRSTPQSGGSGIAPGDRILRIYSGPTSMG